MTDLDERRDPDRPQRHWRGEDVSSRPLKLALLAAAIICIIAIIIYLKARHQPPALHNMRHLRPTSRSTPGNMRAEMYAFPLLSVQSQQEVVSWTPQPTSNSTLY